MAHEIILLDETQQKVVAYFNSIKEFTW